MWYVSLCNSNDWDKVIFMKYLKTCPLFLVFVPHRTSSSFLPRIGKYTWREMACPSLPSNLVAPNSPRWNLSKNDRCNFGVPCFKGNPSLWLSTRFSPLSRKAMPNNLWKALSRRTEPPCLSVSTDDHVEYYWLPALDWQMGKWWTKYFESLNLGICLL